MNEGESFCSQITEENNCAATSWSWSQSVIRTINLVIIVQPWSIIIMEACSYSTVINCCCLWLDCLLDLTLKSTYCAATLEASTCRPSVSCLCFTLCDCAPCWSSFTLWTASNLSVGLECCSSKWHAGWVKNCSLSVLMVNKCSSYSLSYVQKALTTQSPVEKHAK